MIAGPPKGLIMAAPLFANKESVMPDNKPIPEAYSSNHSIKGGLLGKPLFDSYSSPTSPKIHELRARHEALHSKEKDRNLLLEFGQR